MTPPQIPVACVQLRAHDRDDFATAWERAKGLVAEAARAGAKLVVLPEGTVPAYVLGEEPVDPEVLEAVARDVGDLARAHATTIVYGSAKIVRDRTFNAAIAVGPDGSELGFAAKQFLWHFDRRWFSPGETLEPIDTPAGRLGLLVCADGRIPTIAATLCERGAELLVMPTAWVTSGRDPRSFENAQADLMAAVRARENDVPFVVANKVGVERESVAYCGKSAIFDATGAELARGSEDREELVTAIVRPRASAARHARPLEIPSLGATRAERARIAFSLEREPGAIARLADLARVADADVMIAPGAAPHAGLPILDAGQGARGTIVSAAGVVAAIVDDETLTSPRGLVDARASDVDLFVWVVEGDDWTTRFARTRAAELRCYVVVLDAARDRAFAVDPDGVVVAGTFSELRVAAFAYDAGRARATVVAPHTDVARGLATAESIRGGLLASADD